MQKTVVKIEKCLITNFLGPYSDVKQKHVRFALGCFNYYSQTNRMETLLWI